MRISKLAPHHSPLSRRHSDSAAKKAMSTLPTPPVTPTTPTTPTFPGLLNFTPVKKLGFSFKPYLVKEKYFCEHDPSDRDKVSMVK